MGVVGKGVGAVDCGGLGKRVWDVMGLFSLDADGRLVHVRVYRRGRKVVPRRPMSY